MIRKTQKFLNLLMLVVFLAGSGVGLAPKVVQAQEVTVADPETVHIVRRGETLSSIARHYGVTVAALMAYNSLRSTAIYVGQRLLIPRGGAGPVNPIIHIVQRGETLYSISRRYNVTVQAIRIANGLAGNTIYVGQRLLVPGGGAGPVNPIIHIVQRGETLYSISRRYNVTVQAIRMANGLAGNTIYVGQRLLVPGGGAGPVNPIIHIVQRGETLYSISRRYNVTVQAIRMANGLTGNTIYVGQRLQIPTGGSGEPEPEQPQRIEFAPGATSATVTGVVQQAQMDAYLVRASQGQTMRIELISSDASALLGVSGVSDGVVYKRTSVAGTVFEFVLPLTQDYQIEVATENPNPVSYELLVEIPAAGQLPTPQRINFAPGATSATVTGASSAAQPARYVLGAQGGQQMSVTLIADNISAYLVVLPPNGDNLVSGSAVRQWSGVLPATGDYIIEVRNPGTGLTNFTLTVVIV